jgi:hypothetical protein
MATRMDVTYLCDVCQQETLVKEEMFTYFVDIPTTNKKKFNRMEMDLCVDCAESFEALYNDAWRPETNGIKPPIKVTVSKEVPAFGPPICKECGFVAKSFSGLGVHTVRKHGK